MTATKDASSLWPAIAQFIRVCHMRKAGWDVCTVHSVCLKLFLKAYLQLLLVITPQLMQLKNKVMKAGIRITTTTAREETLEQLMLENKIECIGSYICMYI